MEKRNILELIKNARIGHLATVDSNLQPYLTPVVFVLHRGNIDIPLDDKPKKVSTKELKRVKNIQENPKIAFLIDNYDEEWKKLWFVMIKGTAKICDKSEEQQVRTLQRILVEKYPQYSEVGTGNTYIKIRIQKVIYWQYKKV